MNQREPALAARARGGGPGAARGRRARGAATSGTSGRRCIRPKPLRPVLYTQAGLEDAGPQAAGQAQALCGRGGQLSPEQRGVPGGEVPEDGGSAGGGGGGLRGAGGALLERGSHAAERDEPV